MISPTSTARAHRRLRFVLGAVAIMLLNAPSVADAQGLVKGVQQGAKEGNKAAGPVGGVLGGAIGGVVGVFTGVLGVGQNGQAPPPAANGAKQPPGTAKNAKTPKGTNTAAKSAPVMTQDGAPQLTAQQILA